MSETTNDMNGWTPEPPDDDSSDPLGILGEVIAGKYRIDSFIGEGGFGKVYTGVNVKLVQQKVVIKFFTEGKLQDRFDKEAEIICKLDHPGICSLIDYLVEERALVIPYIDGVDLHRYLETHGPLDSALYMRVAGTILQAVAYAHSKSIAHRDIKPGNIMLGTNDNVYLIDFGIAKEAKSSSTETAFFVGTVDFSAPERRQKKAAYNPFLSDIYELGVTLFYLATGTHLYRDRNRPDYSDWNQPAASKLSPRLKRMLKKATHPDPKKRYTSMPKMIADFGRIRRPYRHLPPVVQKIIALAAIIVILLGADALNQRVRLASLPTIIHWDMTRPVIDSSADPIQQAMQTMEQEKNSSADRPDTVIATPTAVTDTAGGPTGDEPIVADTPIIPQMRVAVTPDGPVRLLVDGRDRPVDTYFETESGQHEIVIEHGDFPVYQTVASVPEDTARLSFDLRRRMTSRDSTNVILVILPRDTAYGFTLSCNGRDRYFAKTREFDFYLRDGLWRVSADVRRRDGSKSDRPRVDSIVVGVVGKKTTHIFPEDEGLLQVSSGPAGDQKMRLLIYWSEPQATAGR